MRKFLILWKVWRRYLSIKRKARNLAFQFDKLQRLHTIKIESLKKHYEYELAKERLARQKRDDAWADSFLQLQNVMNVSHRAVNVENQLNLPPNVEELETTSTHQEEILSPDERDYIEDYKDFYYTSGREAGLTDSQIHARWQLEGKEAALEQAQTELL